MAEMVWPIQHLGGEAHIAQQGCRARIYNEQNALSQAMTAPIDSTAAAMSIARIVRRALSERAKTRSTASGARPLSIGEPEREFKGPVDLLEVLSGRVAALDPQAPDFRSRLLRLMIEAWLTHEFGSHLINAPGFQELIDRVRHEMEESSALQADIDAMVAGLK